MNLDAQAYLDASEALLHPAAVRVADSGGRVRPEPEHAYRSDYQRDRDRIVHCSAFRRLDYKTQVFVPHEQDHFRTRLTHTLEVAQVARTLARALRFNEDVAETVGLAHDLGHAPFGHAGEAALDELMAEHGGFEHNRQSLRVVDTLEHPYPDFRGLNLTGVVRRCLARHTTRYDRPDDGEFADMPFAPLEGQLVDLADEIAFTAADTYDALAAGWIETGQLADLNLWRRAASLSREPKASACRLPSEPTSSLSRDAQRSGSGLPGEPIDAAPSPAHRRIAACRNLLAIMADGAVEEAARRLDEIGAASPSDVMTAGRRCAAFGEDVAAGVGQLQDFLLAHVYSHPRSREHRDRARRIVSGLFAFFLADPSRLPERYARRVADQGAHRVICDYIAGMTDRFAADQHERLVRT